MKHIFEHINRRSREFDQQPLFVFLRDASVDPRERLQFVPWSAHFVMTFADLYHSFLREEPARDRYQELVNVHLSEEGTHWKWFLADLTNLNLDPQLRFTDALRLLWSDSTLKTRELAYRMCKLSAGLTSLEKLVMVQAIEATGRVALEAAVPAGREAGAKLGKNLVYFGAHHLDTERQHTLEEDAVHHTLEETVLDAKTRTRLCSLVDDVFRAFEEFAGETFEIAQQRKSFSPERLEGSRLQAGI